MFPLRRDSWVVIFMSRSFSVWIKTKEQKDLNKSPSIHTLSFKQLQIKIRNWQYLRILFIFGFVRYFVFLRSERKECWWMDHFVFYISHHNQTKKLSYLFPEIISNPLKWNPRKSSIILILWTNSFPRLLAEQKGSCISLLGENTPINSQFNSLGKSLKGNFVFSIFLINSLENFGFHSRWTNILFDNDWWWWVSISEIPSMPSLGDGMFYLWGDLEGSPEVPISRSNWTTFYQRLISQDFAIQTPMQVFIFPKWLHFLGKAQMRVFFVGWVLSIRHLDHSQSLFYFVAQPSTLGYQASPFNDVTVLAENSEYLTR